MADPEDKTSTDVPAAPPTEVKVVPDVPFVFADSVSTQVFGPGISKFSLVRIDPDPLGIAANKVTPVLQVTMPLDGFIQMWAFFEHRLKWMVREKGIPKTEIDKAREAMQKLPGGSSDPL